MKRVLHIFGTMNRGGAEMRTLSLMREMREKGIQFDFCVLSGEQGVLDAEIRKLGGQIYYCKLGLMFPFTFISILKKLNFHAVHSHVAYVSGFLLFLSWLGRIKIRVAHFRNTTAGLHSSLIRRVRDSLLRLMINWFATDILAVCEGAMLGFWGASWKEDKRCKVMYNGFDIVDVDKSNNFWQDHILSYQGQKVVINVARMDVQKNHIRQCDIFYQLNKIEPNTILVFIGKENRERKALMVKKIANYGLQENVCFLGLQSNVLSFLKHADILLFPSEWEGLPGVVLEALSVGLPVVGSDLPGIEEIDKQVSGVNIVARRDSDKQWAQTLYKVLKQEVNQKGIIDSFKRSDFLMDNNLQQLYAVYSK